MQEKWADEEAAELEKLERLSKARLAKCGEDAKNKASMSIHSWAQKSRYMKDAVHSAARSLKSTTAREVCYPDLWRLTYLLRSLGIGYQRFGATTVPVRVYCRVQFVAC